MNYYSIYKSSEFKTIHLRKLSDKLDAFSNIQKKTGIVSYYGSSGAKKNQMLMVILKKENIHKKGGIRSKIGRSRSEKGLNII